MGRSIRASRFFRVLCSATLLVFAVSGVLALLAFSNEAVYIGAGISALMFFLLGLCLAAWLVLYVLARRF